MIGGPIEFCKAYRATWKLTFQDNNATGVDSCFAILVAHQYGEINSEALLKNKAHSGLEPLWHLTPRLTESRHLTCLREDKSPSVAMMSRKETIRWTKPQSQSITGVLVGGSLQ